MEVLDVGLADTAGDAGLLLRSSRDLDLLVCEEDLPLLAAAMSVWALLLDCELETNLIMLCSCLDLPTSSSVFALLGDL